MADLLAGFSIVFQPFNFLVLIGGTLLGFLAGAVPGISGTMMVVLLVPLTYTMDPIPAFLIIIAVYCAAVFGGSISAILFRTPGAPESVATVLDGYEMTKKGQAGLALGTSVFSSAVGGVIGSIFLIFLTPQLAKVALAFGPPEYFALTILALSVVSVLGEGNQIKAMIGALLGLFIATIGIDSMTGVNRFTFGSTTLMSGIDFIPVLIGLFAVSEIIRRFQCNMTIHEKEADVKTQLPDLKLIKRLAPIIARSSVIGTIIGILPGIGATTASMVGYSETVRFSKHPEQFGTGIPEGVAGPETANNAAACGAIIPLIALGIPGSATTAVMLGAFILHGIVPGPLMLTEQRTLVYAIFAGTLFANIFVLLISRPFIKGFAQVIRIPFNILGPIILVLCLVGSYAIRNNMLDVWMMLLFGIVGYIFEKFKFPTAPLVIGVVLGEMAEQEFRRSLVISDGSMSIFMQRPIAAAFIIIAIVSFVYPFLRSLKVRSKDKAETKGEVRIG